MPVHKIFKYSVVAAALMGCGGSSDGAQGTGGAQGGQSGTAGSGGQAQAGQAGGSSGGGSSGSGGSAGQPGAGGGAETPLMAQVSGTIYTDEHVKPVKDAVVSVVDDPLHRSVTTGADGGFQLQLEIDTTVFLRVEAPSYATFVRGLVVPDTGAIRDYYLPTAAKVKLFAAVTNTTLDETKGLVWASFENATVAGYSAKLSAPHDASTTLSATENLPKVSSETLSGGVAYWFLVFPNVPAGSTTIEWLAPPGHTCEPRDTVADWRVFADAFTYVDADCD
jgi:hypothetical protein